MGKKSNIIHFPTKLFLLLCAFFPFPVFVVGIFLCVIYLSCSPLSSFTYLGLIKHVRGGSRGSHGGFDLFHRTAEPWLGSPTLSSVCSSLLLSSTSSTASYYYPVLSLLYILLLSKLFISLLTTFIPDFYYLKL